MSPGRAAAVLAQVEAGPAHDWAAELFAEGQGEVGARVVRLLAQKRRAEAVALLRPLAAADARAAAEWRSLWEPAGGAA
jgi:hypothetical protein